MNPIEKYKLNLTRRDLLLNGRGLLGAAALGSLMGVDKSAMASQSKTDDAANRGLPGLPHFAPKAKRVIYLFMAGGPSHMDTFDYKPALHKIHGQELPDSIRQGQRLTGMTSGQSSFPCVAPMFKFKQYGERGTWVNSDILPHMASIVDDVTLIKSMNTEAINHDPAITYINTGTQMLGRPSFGSWLSYGLGSLSDNLPAYVTMISVGAKPGQALYARLWGSGNLPSQHQGVQFRSGKDAVLYLSNPPGVDRDLRRTMLDGIAQINEQKFEAAGDPEIQARIAQYEMAYRMQASVPELMDTSDEPESTYELYGPDSKKKGTFAANCVLARRMAEKGVRFIQLFHRGWDQHNNLPRDIRKNALSIDQPTAGLIKDLKQRGMLEDTVVIWGGEFGRTIYSQGKLTSNNHGRDHHGRCFTTMVAGGGFKAGYDHGITDDYCYNILDKPVHINDLNATIMHNLGVDHEKFTIKYNGLDWRLTGVDGAKVIKDLLA